MKHLKALAIAAATPPVVAIYALTAAVGVFWAVCRLSLGSPREKPAPAPSRPLSGDLTGDWDYDPDFDPAQDPFIGWFDDPRVTANCVPHLQRCLKLRSHDSRH